MTPCLRVYPFLLSQPVPRCRIWAIGLYWMALQGCLVGLLAVCGWLLAGKEQQGLVWQGRWPFLLAGVGGPWLSPLTRPALGSMHYCVVLCRALLCRLQALPLFQLATAVGGWQLVPSQACLPAAKTWRHPF